MKYAWWVIVGLILFLFCTQNAIASESGYFDSITKVTIHSIPEGSKEVLPSTNLDSNSEPNNTTFGGTGSENSRENQPDLSSLTHQELTQETTTSEMTSVTFWSRITQYITGKPQDSTEQHTPTQNTTSQQPGFLEKLSSAISDNITQPLKKGLTSTQNAIGSFLTSASSQISATTQRLYSKTANTLHTAFTTTTQALTSMFKSLVSVETQLIKKFGLPIVGIAFAGTGTGVFLMTNLGRSLFTGAAKIGMTGLASVFDLILHIGCVLTGSISALRNGSTLREGYLRSYWKLKQWTGHDIGAPIDDLIVVRNILAVTVGTLIAAVGVVYVAIPFGEVVIANLEVIAEETAVERMFRVEYSLVKTTIDCTTYTGQCDSPLSTGITILSNALFGISPAMATIDEGASTFSKMATNYTDDAVRAEEGVVTEVTELTGQVEQSAGSQVVGQVDDVVKESGMVVQNTLQSPLTDDEIEIISERIANGHAYDKHLLGDGSFPDLKTKEELKAFIKKVMKNPSDYKLGAEGRIAFWDDASETITIYDPGHVDLGTSYKPKDLKNYFLNKFN